MPCLASRARLGTLLLFLASCGAPQRPIDAALDPDAAATRQLAAAQDRAAATGGAVVAVVHADWCEPCNELQLRLLDTPAGRELLAGQQVVSVDHDEIVGNALAARLRVLGLPTTLVLRPQAGRLREMGRIEGFETVDEYRDALRAALERREPAPAACTDLVVQRSAPAAEVAAALERAAGCLRGDEAAKAATELHGWLDAGALRDAATWPEAERARVLAALRLLGRYEARIARRPRACADVFATLSAWPGTPPASRGGAAYWHARCLVKAGDVAAAEAALEAWLAGASDLVQAKGLVADLLVHEKHDLPRARRLLQEVVAARPQDDWAHYLLAELYAAAGDEPRALEHFDAALALRPGVALYLRHRARVAGPATGSAPGP